MYLCIHHSAKWRSFRSSFLSLLVAFSTQSPGINVGNFFKLHFSVSGVKMFFFSFFMLWQCCDYHLARLRHKKHLVRDRKIYCFGWYLVAKNVAGDVGTTCQKRQRQALLTRLESKNLNAGNKKKNWLQNQAEENPKKKHRQLQI